MVLGEELSSYGVLRDAFGGGFPGDGGGAGLVVGGGAVGDVVGAGEVVGWQGGEVEDVVCLIAVAGISWGFTKRVSYEKVGAGEDELLGCRGKLGLTADRVVFLGIGFVPHFQGQVITFEIRESGWVGREALKHAEKMLGVE